MTTTWLDNLLEGVWASATPGVPVNAVNSLSALLSGIVQAVYPTLIAVAALFAFYWILKSLYHSRF